MNMDLTHYINAPFWNDPHLTKQANSNTIVIARLKTPFAELLAAATTKGICLIEYADTNRVVTQLSRLQKSHSATIENGSSHFFTILNQQLQGYFTEKHQNFDIPLDIRGTTFQMQAWNALQAIPYGETRSYQEQAIAIGNPKAVRAVANANRNNKVSIIIPCHRVIGKNGTMTGYGGGIWRKEYLLNLETKRS